MHSFARHRPSRASKAEALETKVALLTDTGFVVVETEEIRPPRFSAFPGASIIRASRNERLS